MNEEKILKTKLEYHKTWLTIMMSGTIASIIGYWANRENSLARTTFWWFVIIFAIGLIVFLNFHEKRYRQLIRFYIKNGKT